MSPSRFLVFLIIFISFFILTVSAKGHHRQPQPSTGQSPNLGTNVGGSATQNPATTLPLPSPKPVNGAAKPANPAVPSKPVVANGKSSAAPAPPPPPTPPRRGVEAREFLKAHNLVRMKHNQTVYKWDKKLARFARRWGLTRAADCKMIHSMGPYGENMFWGKYDHWTPTDAVESWAVEYKDYNAETNTCTPNKMCGHYTQIVWHESNLLGCSRIRCFNGSVVVICEYDPPGNYVDENPFGKVFNTEPLPPPTAEPTSMTSAQSNSSPSTLPPPPPPPSPDSAA